MPGRLAKFSFGFRTALGTRLLLYISVLMWAQIRRPYAGDPTQRGGITNAVIGMASLELVDIALEMDDGLGRQADCEQALELSGRSPASGQKNAAMAVTILARDLRCVFELDPSQPAKLRCRRFRTTCAFGGSTRIRPSP